MDSTDTISIEYWNAYRIINQMMRDRGYKINSTDVDMTIEDFQNRFMNDEEPDYDLLTKDYINDRGDLTYVKFLEPTTGKSKKKGAAGLEKIFLGELKMKVGTKKVGILVINQNLTPAQKSDLAGPHPYDIQIFHISDLQYNPITHMFGVKYQALTKDQQEAFFKKYGKSVTPNRMPQLADDDIISRYYNFKVGQVIRVLSESLMIETFGNKEVSYWIVEHNNVK